MRTFSISYLIGIESYVKIRTLHAHAYFSGMLYVLKMHILTSILQWDK